MKEILLTILAVLCLTPITVFAETKDDVTIYMFRGYDCSHCEEALKYFDKHRDLIPSNVTIMTYEVYKNANNAKLQDEVAEYLNVDTTKNYGTPFFVIGSEYIKGYGTGTLNELVSIANDYINGKEEYVDVIETVREKENLNIKGIDFNTLFSKPSSLVTIIVYSVFGVIILGIGGMILFSRKR